MEFLLIGVVAIGTWFYWVKRRGDAYVQDVANLVIDHLRSLGESETTINNFLNSMVFSVTAKTGFGKLSATETAHAAMYEFDKTRDIWCRE